MNRLRTVRRIDARGMSMYCATVAVIVGLYCATTALGQDRSSFAPPKLAPAPAAATPEQLQAEVLEHQVQVLNRKFQVAEARLQEAAMQRESAPDEQAKREADARYKILMAEALQAQAELDVAQTQAAATRAQRRAEAVEPSVAAQSVQTFRLQHARSGVVADLLDRVYGDQVRVAVDEPSNTLIVMFDATESGPIHDLVSTLDSAPVAAGQEQPVEERTLQLRILWLMDGLPDGLGIEPGERYVSPMVVDVLHGLGLEHPKIVCQHSSTLSAQPENWSEFDLYDPVKIGDWAVHVQGNGRLLPLEGNRFRVDLRIGIEAEDRENRRGDRDREDCSMSGSLVMPLEHYVVLGTTNYIEQNGSGNPVENHPTAFVVFLQEAPIAPR